MPTQENYYNTPNGIIDILNIFKGRKALICDYSFASYFNTRLVLLSLGFDVDIMSDFNDITNAITNKTKYDVILCNNVFKYSSGEVLLHMLKSIENFNTPVILHSVTKDLEEYAANVGFDGFLAKPIKQDETIALLNKLLAIKQKSPS